MRQTNLRAWTVTLALAVGFIATALATTSAVYAAVDLVVLWLLYGLVATALTHGSLLVSRAGAGFAVPAGLTVGLVLAWHWREQTRAPGTGRTLWAPESLGPFLLGAAAAASLFLGLVVWARAGPTGRPGLATAVSAVGLATVLATAWHGSTVLRWHLLQHNRLIGTPGYHLLSPPIRELEREVWRRHRARVDPTDVAADQPTGADMSPPDSPSAEGSPRGTLSADGSRTAALSTEAPQPSSPSPGGAPRHLVFVLLDTWRADSLRAYGGETDVMPALDRLAGRSAVFTDVMASSSWTRPSMASMFTGLAPETHGAVGWTYALPEPRRTVAEILHDRGRATAAVVSNHRAVGRDSGFAQGFESFHELRDADPYARAEAVTDAALSWLDGGLPDQAPREGRPVFLWAHYLDPHAPYLSGDEIDPHGATPVSHAEARSRYESELAYVDGQVERLLEGVRRRLGDDVVVVVTSDHGEEFGEHDGRGHGHSLYPETIHIPLLVEGPGIEPRDIDEALEGRDVFELLLHLATTPAPDLTGWARETRRPVRYASVFHTILLNSSGLDPWIRPTRARLYLRLVERGGWRLIWSAYGPTWELYDVAADPGHLVNRYRDESGRAGRLAALLEELPERWAARLVPVGVSEEALDDLRALGYAR